MSDFATSFAVLIEDTRELQCDAPNLVALRTVEDVVSLSDLVALVAAAAAGLAVTSFQR